MEREVERNQGVKVEKYGRANLLSMVSLSSSSLTRPSGSSNLVSLSNVCVFAVILRATKKQKIIPTLQKRQRELLQESNNKKCREKRRIDDEKT